MFISNSNDSNGSGYQLAGALLDTTAAVHFLSFNIVCLFFILLPLTVLNVAVLVLLVKTGTAKTRTMQLLLFNIPVSCLFVSLGLAMYHISGIALDLSENSVTLGVCRATVFIIAFGGQARILFMILFAFSVYVIVCCRKQATCRKLSFFIVLIIVLWGTSFVCSIPVAFEDVVNVTFGNNVSCGPFPVSIGSYLYIGFYGILFGVFAFVLTLTFLLMTICYIRTNTVSAMEGEMNKAMSKLGFFLVLGNVLSICGQVLPPLIAAFLVAPTKAESGSIGIFLPQLAVCTYLLINLSLVPSPILIVVYFNPVREKVKELLCHCRYRTDLKPSSHPSFSTTNPLSVAPNRLNSVSTVDVSIPSH